MKRLALAELRGLQVQNRDGWRVWNVCSVGLEGRGHAGGRSHSAGDQQRGVVEERLEEACHFLQLLTDGGHLTGEDTHLGGGGDMETIYRPGAFNIPSNNQQN